MANKPTYVRVVITHGERRLEEYVVRVGDAFASAQARAASYAPLIDADFHFETVMGKRIGNNPEVVVAQPKVVHHFEVVR